MPQRPLDIAIISDVHLGTFGCHARELLKYLRSIDPKVLILNGDLVDRWHATKKPLPDEHDAVLQLIIQIAARNKVYFISGNHDRGIDKQEHLRESNIIFRSQLELFIDQKKYLIFHGDDLDTSVLISPLVSNLGAGSYKSLIYINRIIERCRASFGLPRWSLAHKIKFSLQKAVQYITEFEKIATLQGTKQGFDYIVCGHIHVPAIKKSPDGKTTYMNAGDWIENLSALEYVHRKWNVYRYDPADYVPTSPRLRPNEVFRKRKDPLEKRLSISSI